MSKLYLWYDFSEYHTNNSLMKNLLFFSLISLLFWSCEPKETPAPVIVEPIKDLPISSSAASKWAEATLEYIKFQPNNSPTFSSRSMGYLGLTMYESVVQGSKIYQSIAPNLDGLGVMPMAPAKVDWETALNEGQRSLLSRFYQHSYFLYNARLDTLHKKILQERTLAVKDTAIISSSRKFGKSIADVIYEWSLKDGGDLAYLRPFDPSFKWPAGSQYWVPPVNGQSSSPYPLMPKWGSNRTFIKTNSEIPIPQPLMYSTDKNSDYYKDFKEIYDVTNMLTQEQKEIAIWWADDPIETAAPGGHSYNLARQILEVKPLNIFEASHLFAKVGMSIADAFVCCWKVKYTYNSERPANYIRRNINGAFIQFWPEPPFPAFISGHSTQVGAAAAAMISVFGNEVTFTDRTHVGRPKDGFRNVEFKARSFSKISDAAEECGISRIYGGIHTKQDNVVGLEFGKKVGENINKLPWKKAGV